MTTEQRVYITVNELLEIEFRCKKCHVVFAWPLAAATGFRVNNCPGYNTDWFGEMDHRRKNLDQILIALRGFRETLADANFELRFRITPHAAA